MLGYSDDERVVSLLSEHKDSADEDASLQAVSSATCSRSSRSGSEVEIDLEQGTIMMAAPASWWDSCTSCTSLFFKSIKASVKKNPKKTGALATVATGIGAWFVAAANTFSEAAAEVAGLDAANQFDQVGVAPANAIFGMRETQVNQGAAAQIYFISSLFAIGVGMLVYHCIAPKKDNAIVHVHVHHNYIQQQGSSDDEAIEPLPAEQRLRQRLTASGSLTPEQINDVMGIVADDHWDVLRPMREQMGHVQFQSISPSPTLSDDQI